MDWVIIGLITLYNVLSLWVKMREDGMSTSNTVISRDFGLRSNKIPQSKTKNLNDDS